MSDRCYSTLICAERDKDNFEKMGYRVEESKALSADGKEMPGAVVMVDEEAESGHYDELTSPTGVPFLVSNGACPGAFGDHLIVSDGEKWHYSEALHESNYPALRVEPCGVIRDSEVDDAREYWTLYSAALAAIKEIARHGAGRKMNETSRTGQNRAPASIE